MNIQARECASKNPSYSSWKNMRLRCSDPNHASFQRYGAKGITVCERWSSFKNFLEDMGSRPEGMSLDRIRNDEGYSPENCRWATRSEQQLNKNNTIRIDFDGKCLTLIELADAIGVSYGAIFLRYKKGDRGEQLARPGRYNSGRYVRS